MSREMRVSGFLSNFFLVSSLVCGLSLGCAIYRGGPPPSEEDLLRLSSNNGGSLRKGRDLTTNCGPDDPVPPNRVDTTARLEDLRSQMLLQGVDAYYVPLDEEGRRTWISGFSGSNGDAIVTMDQAACWTDGRYFLQAGDQLDCNWELMRMGQPGVPTYTTWLKESAGLSSGSVVAVDGNLLSADTFIKLKTELAEDGIDLVNMVENLIDNVWTETEGRPPFLPKTLVVQEMLYAGQNFEAKITELRDNLLGSEHSWMVVSEKDEIAWLFNLRGEGEGTGETLFYSPLFHSLALITPSQVLLWLHMEKVTQEIRDHLNPQGCETSSTCVTLGDFPNALSELEDFIAANLGEEKVLVSKPSVYLTGASYAVYEAIGEDNGSFDDSPVLDAKSIKNSVESPGMVNAHLRDAYAVCEWAAFMENQVEVQGNTNWTEISAAQHLSALRRAQPLNRGDSFTTISASGSNAAIIHYSPVPETDAAVNDSAIFMVDSGGQYLDGTTDITRTFHYGNPDPEMIEMYTAVLMGHIDLARTVVPENTRDAGLDLATRQYIYRKGLDYRHGTGHGIGAYLSVHEGPASIKMSGSGHSLRKDMFFSDEPGYYKDGEYGIRIESILQVVDRPYPEEPFGGFMGFESVTLVPYEPKLIDFSAMNPEQIVWFNDFNAKVLNQVGGHFLEVGRSDVYDWIARKTEYVNPGRSKWVQMWKDNEV